MRVMVRNLWVGLLNVHRGFLDYHILLNPEDSENCILCAISRGGFMVLTSGMGTL